MLKAYKYRLYPTKKQQVKIEQTIGVCRLVYNLALETKIRAWQSANKNISAIDLCYQLPELKESFPWIAEVDSQAVQASIKNIDKAYHNFFQGYGFPKFRSKKNGGSFQCPNNVRRLDFETQLLTIPKIKNIPIKLSRSFDGKIKTITISKTSTGKYFASILVDNERELSFKQPINPLTTIGIDVGIKSFVVTSNGKSYEPNRYLKNSLKRLQCLQRRASRKKKASKNRKKANLCVAKVHEKITNQRADYVHKVTTSLICDSQAETFVIEDMHVDGLLKNRKLSRAISDASFGEFFRQMKYKCDWYGKNLVIINRFAPSSKRCFECGEINHGLTLSDREWECKCGAHHDRDFNAAKNIKWFGLNQIIFKEKTPEGIGEGPVESRRLRWAKKQENLQFIPTP